MAGKIESFEVKDASSRTGHRPCWRIEHTIAAPGVTLAAALADRVVISISGSGAFTAIAERSATGDAGTFVPAEDSDFTGDADAGFPARVYDEPDRGHWRLNVTAMTGALTVHITGTQGQ